MGRVQLGGILKSGFWERWIAGCTLAAVLSQVPLAMADYKQAVAFFNQGRFEKVIQELKPDLEASPDWEFGHRLMGLSYLRLRNNALAISSLSRAVQLESKTPGTFLALGEAYFNMRRYDRCIEILNKGEELVKAANDRHLLFHIRGSAHYMLESYDDAARQLTAAIRYKGSEWTDFSQLGIAYCNLDRLDESIEALNKALALKPGHNATTEFLGKAYFKKGVEALTGKDYDQALDYFGKARLNNPSDGYIYYNMAEAQLFQQDYGQAEQSLNKALELMPRSAEVFQRLGLVLEKQKKWDLSLNAYQKALELRPSPPLEESVKRVTELKKR